MPHVHWETITAGTAVGVNQILKARGYYTEIETKFRVKWLKYYLSYKTGKRV